MNSDYQAVQDALQGGADPAMLCETCPWDRLCVEPPTMTRADVERQFSDAKRQDEEARAEAGEAGKSRMPMASLLAAVTFAGRDTAGRMCPVFALRLRSGSGRHLADSIRARMKSWDDQEVPS